VTQYLATFDKILFTKSSFSRTKCTKIVIIFGRGSTPYPAGGGGGLRRFPISLSRPGREILPFPVNAFGVSTSGLDF